MLIIHIDSTKLAAISHLINDGLRYWYEYIVNSSRVNVKPTCPYNETLDSITYLARAALSAQNDN